MLRVTLYPSIDSAGADDDLIEIDDIDYVSLISDGTYGKPALIAPTGKPGEARAAIGERVLYINTRFVPLFEIMRTSD